MVKVDLSWAKMFFDAVGPDYAAAAEAHRALFGRSGPGSEFIGWLDLPQRIIETGLKAITSAAEKIKKQSEVLLVISSGGITLPARAAIEMLSSPDNKSEVLFMGDALSPDAINKLIARLGDRDFSVNIICCHGSSLENALVFRVAKSLLESKYGRAAAKRRIYVTTDYSGDTLRDIVKSEGYDTLLIPSDVNGKFNALSAVGLLPMAVAGVDIEFLLRCAAEEMRNLALCSPENPAWQYAAARQHLYSRGKSIELLACYEPSFRFLGQWWKQLFAESEGRSSIGIFPCYADYGAELHSLEQYIHDGPHILLETVLSFDDARSSYKLPFEMGDPDGLNHLAGRSFHDIAKELAAAVKSDHISNGVPNIGISVPRMDVAGFAAIICFFELACGISAYMMGVNPFDSVSADERRKNMFRMLKEKN